MRLISMKFFQGSALVNSIMAKIHRKILVQVSVIFLTVLFLFCFTGFKAYASDPVTIKVLTLDNRPPNNLFLKQLGAIAGINMEIRFGSELENLPEDWLMEADIISLNAVVAESLVGSRGTDPRLLNPPVLNPDALVHFAVPRVQPTVYNEEQYKEFKRVAAELENTELQLEVLAAITGERDLPEEPYQAMYVDRITGWIDFLER